MSVIEVGDLICGAISHPGVRPAGQWRVLHTKARQEKALARFLHTTGRSFYLPLVQRSTLIRGRKFISHMPLFPGYVFLWGEREDGFAAVETKRVCQVIEVDDQDQFEQEIAQIAGALEAGGELELYPHAVEGTWCRVIRGPFMGLEGWVVKRLSRTRLILEIGILGRGAALEVDADFLEPVD